MTGTPDRAVGSTHRDTDGNMRVVSRFGFNAYATVDDARRSAEGFFRAGAPVYLWELADGSFDFTAIPDPMGPWYGEEDAKFLEHFHTPGNTAGAKGFRERCETCGREGVGRE